MKDFAQRMEEARKIIFEDTSMLMTNPIKRDSIKNKDIGGKCTGFTFELDNLSYRGVWVSTLEKIELTLDGEKISNGVMLLSIKDMKLPLSTLAGHTEVFWGAEDKCAIEVNQVGGIPEGEHTLQIKISKRPDFGHSYGEGEEGYEQAAEFVNPEIIMDEATFKI